LYMCVCGYIHINIYIHTHITTGGDKKVLHVYVYI